MDLAAQVQGPFLWNVDGAGFPNHMSHAQPEGNCPFLTVFSTPESSSMSDTFLINIDLMDK